MTEKFSFEVKDICPKCGRPLNTHNQCNNCDYDPPRF